MELNELLSSIEDEEMKTAVNTLATNGVDTLTVDTQKAMVEELRAVKAADLLEKLKQETQFKSVRKIARKALNGLRAFGVVPENQKKTVKTQVREILNGPKKVAIKPSDKLGQAWVLFNIPEKGGVGPEIPMLSMRGNKIMSMSVFESSRENIRKIEGYIDGQGGLPMVELPYDKTARFMLDALVVSQAKTTGFTIDHAAHIAAMFRPFRDAGALVEEIDRELSEIDSENNDKLSKWEIKLPDPVVRGEMKRAAMDGLSAMTAVDDEQRKTLAINGVMVLLKGYMQENAKDLGLYFRFAAYSKYKADETGDAKALFELAKAMDASETFDPAGFSLLQGFAERLVQATMDEKVAKQADAQDENKEGEQDEGKD